MSAQEPARLYQAFLARDPAAAIKVVEETRAAGVAQTQLFDTLFAPALALLGASWASGQVDEIAFTQAAVVAEQVTSFVAPPARVSDTGVSVLIGCMQRDRHAIMKNIVGAALKEAGNRVVDLGVDVRPAEFLAKAEETGSRLVVVCAEILQVARDTLRVREMFASAGHDDVVILVAGRPFEADAQIARAAGANGVVHGAEQAIKLVAKVAADRFGAKPGGGA